MIKVIPIDDVDAYIDNGWTPRDFAATVDDAGTNVFDTSNELVNGLRLDHFESHDAIGVIEWELDAADTIQIPYSPNFGGSVTGYEKPFTGNGFVAYPDRLVPELFVPGDNSNPLNGAMYVVDQYGTKTLVAIWTGSGWAPP